MHILYEVRLLTVISKQNTFMIPLLLWPMVFLCLSIWIHDLNSSWNDINLVQRNSVAGADHSDGQKSLSKNGIQINAILIIGVEPLDPMQRQALNKRINNRGFRIRCLVFIHSRLPIGMCYLHWNTNYNNFSSYSACFGV